MSDLLTSARSKLLAVWLVALLLSGGLAWAGQRWAEPLPIDLAWVGALVLVPPALMGLVLLRNWEAGPSAASPPGDGGESLQTGKEQQG